MVRVRCHGAEFSAEIAHISVLSTWRNGDVYSPPNCLKGHILEYDTSPLSLFTSTSTATMSKPSYAAVASSQSKGTGSQDQAQQQGEAPPPCELRRLRSMCCTPNLTLRRYRPFVSATTATSAASAEPSARRTTYRRVPWSLPPGPSRAST